MSANAASISTSLVLFLRFSPLSNLELLKYPTIFESPLQFMIFAFC